MADTPRDASEDHGVFSIAVASEMTGLGVQSLRLYESKGLLTPSRTAGGTRRYSRRDIAILRRVVTLVDEGINLAGIRKVLHLEADNRALRQEISDLSQD